MSIKQNREENLWLRAGHVYDCGHPCIYRCHVHFRMTGYEAKFNWVDKNKEESVMVYELPALVGPHKGELITKDRLEPVVDLPPVFQVER